MTIKNNNNNSNNILPSAPPEAELYYGTAEAANEQHEVPVASAVCIDEEPETTATTSSSGGEGGYGYADHIHETASTAPLLDSHTATDATTVHVTGLGLEPRRVTCPFCHRRAVTNVHRVVDLSTMIVVGILFLVFWPFCWLPLVIPGCKVTEHFCSNCHRKVGVVPACAEGCGCCGC